MPGKKNLRSDRVHSNAKVGTTEEVLTEIAQLPDHLEIKIVRKSDGRDVRDDAIMKNL